MTSSETTLPKSLLMCALICLWVLTSTGFEALEFAKSSRWESTEGVVLESDVQVAGSPSPIEYQFRIDDRNYRSTRIAFSEFLGNRSWNKSFQEKYMPNETVTVFYDPDNPDNSVLERRISPGGFVWFTMSLVGLAMVGRRLEKI